MNKNSRFIGPKSAELLVKANGLVSSPFLALVLPFVFCFDFRGEEGGTLIQYLMGIVSLLIPCFCLIQAKFKVVERTGFFMVFSFIAILVGLSSAIIYDAPVEQVVRVAFPFVVFVVSFWVGALVGEDSRVCGRVAIACVISGVVSSLFRLYYGFVLGGLVVDSVRYQILSPALPLLCAYAVAAVCYSRRLPWLAIVLACFVCSVIALSVTRSFIITLSLAILGAIFCLWRVGFGNSYHVSFSRWRVPALVLVLLAFMSGIGAAAFFRPDVLNEWYVRLFFARSSIDGYDITYITRVAEAVGIWEGVSASPVSLLIGRGFGNFYYWSADYVAHMRQISESTPDEFISGGWAASHSAFVYGLFFGGVIGAVWVVYIFMVPLYRAACGLRLWRAVVECAELRLIVFFFLTVLLYFSQSFTSDPFGERMSAQLLGITSGILVVISRGPRIRN